MDCGLYSSWSFDSAYCLSLPPEPTATEIGQFRVRDITSNIEPSKTLDYPTTTRMFHRFIDGYGTAPSPTDYDRCLPGPTSCNLLYSGKSCPTPYSRVFDEENDGQSTVYCCFSAPVEIRQEGYTMVHTGIKGTNVRSLICSHTGQVDKIHPMLPSGSYSGPPESADPFILTMRAFAVTHKVEPNSTTSTPLSPPLSSLSSTPTNPSKTTELPSPTPNPHRSTKISIGTGIGIGGLVLVSVILAIVYFLRRRQKQRRLREGLDQNIAKNIESDLYAKPELDGQSATVAELENQAGEIDSQAINELGTGKYLSEMDGRNEATELAAEQRPIEMPAWNR